MDIGSKYKKEITYGKTVSDFGTALRSAIPHDRRLSSVSELDSDAKLLNFFEYARYLF